MVSLVNEGSNTVAPGQTVTLDVMGTVTGSNGTADEGLQSAYGAVFSSNGGFVTFTGGSGTDAGASFQAASPFTATVQQGTVGTYNGGDILGVPPGGAATSDLYARDGSMDMSSSVDTGTFKLGTVTFTISPTASGSTQVSWIPLESSTGGPSKVGALWAQDGSTSVGPTNSTVSPSGYSAGQPITLSTATPEPGTLGLVLVGGFGLLLRRRRTA